MSTTTLRPELELPLPHAMDRLPIHRGYPVPWFVSWTDAQTPEFRAMDPYKWLLAVGKVGKQPIDHRKARCWVCGGEMFSRLGFMHTFAFLIGPMCAINRVSSEPPSHIACAEWSARNCPFMARPHAKRREDGIEDLFANMAGVGIPRNPGVGLVWKCDRYTIFNDGKGKPLIQLGMLTQPPTWWAEGRPATRAEVLASIDSGFPLLEETLALEEHPDAARAELLRRKDEAMKLLPAV